MRHPSPKRVPALDVEWEILTAATANALRRPQVTPRLDHLLSLSVDWPRLRELTEKHCVVAPIYRGLEPYLNRLPHQFAEDLEGRFRLNQARNRRLMSELARVARLLRGNGIEIIPYKGPEMAARCYGDPALRQFKDLDFLIRKADLARVCALLSADGYESEMPMGARHQAYRERHFKDWSFVRRDVPGSAQSLPDLRPHTHPKYQTLILEPHWSITARRFHLPLDYAGLWQRSGMRDLEGTPLLEMAPEDLVLMICVNACKGGCPRLQLVADIAAAMHSFDASVWQAALNRARQIDAKRILLLSTRLAEHLLHAPMPAPLRAAEHEDSALPRLTKLAISRMQRGTNRFAAARLTGMNRLTFFIWEQHRNKIRYLYESATEPKYWHLTHLPLPRPLHGLYRLMVPLVDSLRFLRRLVRGMSGPTTPNAGSG